MTKIKAVRPYLLGFILGLFAAAIVVKVASIGIPETQYLAPTPFTENTEFLKYMPVIHSYKGGVITNRTERYYHRGLDWIMIKDFPEHTDKYEVSFKGVSEELWSK